MNIVASVCRFIANQLAPITLPPGGIATPPSSILLPVAPTRIPGTGATPPGPDEPREPDLGRYRLTLLRESRDEAFVLDEVSHLPNREQPEPIGKPGDFIHGVRLSAFTGAPCGVILSVGDQIRRMQ